MFTQYLKPAIQRLLVGTAVFTAMHLAYAQSVTYALVTIGNAGNPSDTTGFGAVSYAYKIGKYEVTVANYVAFLNAVAKTDTYGLWNNAMQSQPSIAGITRSGSQGSYVYAAMNGTSGTAAYSPSGTPPFRTILGQDSSNYPLTYVSWFNAARFANWMANGQPLGAQDSKTTEDGAYKINGATTAGAAPGKNALNPNTGYAPSYYLPNENEWYKAAYYDQRLNNGVGGYYNYATMNNNPPGNAIPGSSTVSTESVNNQANYIYGSSYLYAVNQAAAIVPTQYYLTPVGSFSNVTSAFGAFDMNGNVWEMNTLTGAGSINIGIRGGAWTSLASYLAKTYYLGTAPYTTAVNVGFRLAAPATTP
jgi:formylglycine-generating enzyme